MNSITIEACRHVVQAMAGIIQKNRDELSALDAAIGDGDHGFNMDVALQAAVRDIDEAELSNPAQIFRRAGSIMMNTMGGASGIVFGSFFVGGSEAIKDKESLTLPDILSFFESGIEKVQLRGKARAKDKTLLDALLPALAALKIARHENALLPEAMQRAARAAQSGAEETKEFVAQHGRAKFLGERSLGHQDAGATSMALMLIAWAAVVANK